MTQTSDAPSLALLSERLSVVIPAFNEREGLGTTLRDLIAVLPRAEIIVVDDGSTDGTGDVVREFPRVTCVRHVVNRGYGAGLKTGMRQATREFVAWFDADNEHRPTDLASMLQIVAGKSIAAVIAQREKSGPSPMRNWGKRVIWALARSFKVNVGEDINCGLRVFRRETIIRYLQILPNGYSASITSTMVMLERGYPIEFFPIMTNKRIGHSKVRVNDGFMAMMLVLRTVMLFAPLRIFFRAGLVLFLAGLIYGVVTAMMLQRGFPTGALGLSFAGIMLAVFGLMADQISQMRLAQYDESSFNVLQAGQAEAKSEERRVDQKHPY
jgi:glycosyltransferase involved in cell wall biosynthesis